MISAAIKSNEQDYHSSQVLYIDHQGNANPLSTTFLPTAARYLSSSSFSLDLDTDTLDTRTANKNKYNHRGGPSSSCSSITEVDAAYCHQCLAFYDPSSASQYQGVCPRAQCRLCPVCVEPLTMNAFVSDDETRTRAKCVYQCNYCRWISLECDIVGSVEFSNADEVTIDAGMVSKLSSDLTERMIQREIDIENKLIFDSLARDWGKISYISSKSKIIGTGGILTNKSFKKAWSVEQLETALAEKTKVLRSPVMEYLSHVSKLESHQFPNESQQHAIPLRMPLRSKKSRRCKLELVNGRPGILVKAKVNPLEGDSSLRSGHGQWWKKDSSAIHMLPNISVVTYGFKIDDDTGRCSKLAILLKVQNPTLGIVRMRFGPLESTATTEVMHNILLDPYERLYVDASVIKISKKEAFPKFTDIIVLEASEDILLGLGKNSEGGNIDDIQSWDVSSRLSSANDNKISLVSQKKDIAWFEVIFDDINIMERDNPHNYVVTLPLGFQIQVGDGSWESSLIKSDSGNREPDFVQFWIKVVLKV